MDAPLPPELNDHWNIFFSSEVTRGQGEDIYDEVFNDGLLFPLQRKREMARMLQIARATQPKVVYEIGADKGGGLYHWCKSLPTVERVIACEIRGTPYSRLFEKAFPHIDFLWLGQSSYDEKTVNLVDDWLHFDEIDCLFIDGDKSRFDVDFAAYFPLMVPHGVVFMHDINDRAPTEGYERTLKRTGFKHEEIIDITESSEAITREQNGTSPTSAHEGWLRYWNGRSCGVGVIYLGEQA